MEKNRSLRRECHAICDEKSLMIILIEFRESKRHLLKPKNLMENIEKEVKAYISKNQTNKAISILLDASEENKVVNNAIQIILGEYNELVSQRLKGILSDQDVTRKTNSIHDRLLIALESFDENGKVLPTAKVENGQTTQKLFRFGLTLTILGALLVIITLAAERQVEGDWIYVIGLLGYFICIGGVILLGGWFVAFVFRAVKGR